MIICLPDAYSRGYLRFVFMDAILALAVSFTPCGPIIETLVGGRASCQTTLRSARQGIEIAGKHATDSVPQGCCAGLRCPGITVDPDPGFTSRPREASALELSGQESLQNIYGKLEQAPVEKIDRVDID